MLELRSRKSDLRETPSVSSSSICLLCVAGKGADENATICFFFKKIIDDLPLTCKYLTRKKKKEVIFRFSGYRLMPTVSEGAVPCPPSAQAVGQDGARRLGRGPQHPTAGPCTSGTRMCPWGPLLGAPGTGEGGERGRNWILSRRQSCKLCSRRCSCIWGQTAEAVRRLDGKREKQAATSGRGSFRGPRQHQAPGAAPGSLLPSPAAAAISALGKHSSESQNHQISGVGGFCGRVQSQQNAELRLAAGERHAAPSDAFIRAPALHLRGREPEHLVHLPSVERCA